MGADLLGIVGGSEGYLMIHYSKASLRIVELLYNESEPVERADIVRFQARLAPVDGGTCERRHTILIDLSQDETVLRSQLNRTTRNEVSRAGRDGVQCSFHRRPGAGMLEEFSSYWKRFAPLKGLPPLNAERLNGMLECGALALSSANLPGEEPLAWHCYVYTACWARLLHSASLFRESADKEYINTVSRANRLLHWQDIVEFRSMGVETYDFGGWYDGAEDQHKLKINQFKEGFGGTVTPVYYSDRGLTVKGSVAVYVRRLLKRKDS